VAIGGYPDQVSIHPKSSQLFPFPSCRQKEMILKKREKEKEIGSKKKEKKAHICP
jgi:hypothetical protein